jgi:hypothetical protein
MSDFITNLVHRGAGLLRETAVMPPFQPRFAPDVKMAAPDVPPLPDKTQEQGSTPATVTKTEKPNVPEPPMPRTAMPEQGQGETPESTRSLPVEQQPDQPGLDESPPAALSPPPRDVLEELVKPREAPVTTFSEAETMPIVQPSIQSITSPGKQRKSERNVEPQITVSRVPEPAATSPAASVPPLETIHHVEEETVVHEHVMSVPESIETQVLPPDIFTTSDDGPDTVVADSPVPMPIIQPAPMPWQLLPNMKAEVNRPTRSETGPSTVEVRIGTVEVRANQPPAPAPSRTGPKPQGFERYARLRGGGEWE